MPGEYYTHKINRLVALGLPRRLIPACLSFSTRKHVALKIMEKTNTSTNFTWIPFYREFAKKLLAYRSNRTKLIEKIKDIFSKMDSLEIPKLEKDNIIIDIDPFTVFGLFNKNITYENRRKILSLIKDSFNINAKIPNDFNAIPVLNSLKSTFYYFQGEREDQDIDNLWDMFQIALEYEQNKYIENDFIEKFSTVIKQKGVKWNITMGLFWISPYTYINLDDTNRTYLKNQKIKDFGSKMPDGNEYLSFCKQMRSQLENNKNSINNFPDFSFYAYCASSQQFWIKPADPDQFDFHGAFKKFGFIDWTQKNNFKVNDTVFIYASGSEQKICCKTIVERNNIPYDDTQDDSEFNKGSKFEVSEKNKYVRLRLLQEIDDAELSYANLVKLEYINSTIQGCIKITNQEFIDFLSSHFEGKTSMKPETKQNNPNIPLNQILFGPPGTGKTYNTVIKAMEIINPGLIVQYKAEAITYDDVKKAFDEAKKNGQIEFVTFHQSYAYEEFVEGIKPYLGSEDRDRAELKYVLKNGIFKEICKRAENPTIENQVETSIRKNPNIWKVSLKGSGENPVRTDCMDNNRIRIGWDEYGETIDEEIDFKSGGKDVLSAFMDKMQIGDIVLSCYSAETIDAIGVITSEYAWDSSLLPKGYSRYRKVKWLVKGLNYNILKLNNDKIFAPATVYQLNNISLRDILDIVKSNGQTINYKTDKPHVLIIDEINRGNISKIFGELITLIEPDKRQGESHAIEVKLPYSKDKFSVPKNLYIIGTMNTSDRSIATVDIALRRRFKFIEMMPDKNLVADFGIGFKEIFEKLNTRIKLLLDRDHQIGHSYFINTKYENADAVTLKEIWFSEIIPLLNEYFYCDWEKLRRIIPGFLKQVSVPDDLKGECEDSIYEFKTMEEVSDLKAAFEQKENKKDS